MSDPVRLRDDDAEATGAATLLRAGRRPRPMSTEQRARMATRVGRVAAVPVALTLPLWLKGVAIAAVGVGVGFGVASARASLASRERASSVSPGREGPRSRENARVLREAPTAPPSTRAVALAGARPVAETAAIVATATVPGPARRVSSVSIEAARTPDENAALAPGPFAAPPEAIATGAGALPVSAPSAAPAPEPHEISELELVDRAQRALGANPSEALALTETAAGVAHPTLAAERERIAIEALVRLRRRDEARARAERFFRDFPGDLSTDRVRGLVDAAP